MKVKKIIACVSLVLAVSSSNSYAAIPVLDAANLANTAENIVQWGKQLTEMRNHLTQLQNTYNSLNGLRNVGNLLKNDLLTQYLPKDYQKAMNDMMNAGNGDFSSISGALKDIVAINQKYTCAQMNHDQASIKKCEAEWNKLAIQKNVGDMGYKNAAKNIDNLEQFVNSITTSTDPKSLQDLQARIAVEQVRLQNEQMKLETIKMMQAADEKLKAQQHRDAMNTGLNLGSDGGIHF